MRVLEVGPGKSPSMLVYRDDIDYVSVDRFSKHDSGLASTVCRDLLDVSVEMIGQFDLVYGANVLGNNFSATNRLKIVKKSMEFLNDAGRLVMVESLSPDSAGLCSIAEEIEAAVYDDSCSEFKTEWLKHHQEEIFAVKRRLNLKKPFKMLEKVT